MPFFIYKNSKKFLNLRPKRIFLKKGLNSIMDQYFFFVLRKQNYKRVKNNLDMRSEDMMFLLFGILSAYLVIRMLCQPSHSTCPQKVGNASPDEEDDGQEMIGAGADATSSGSGPLKAGFGPIVPPSQVNHNHMKTINKEGVKRGAQVLLPSTYRTVGGSKTGVDINFALRAPTTMPSVSGDLNRDNVSDAYYQKIRSLKKGS